MLLKGHPIDIKMVRKTQKEKVKTLNRLNDWNSDEEENEKLAEAFFKKEVLVKPKLEVVNYFDKEFDNNVRVVKVAGDKFYEIPEDV